MAEDSRRRILERRARFVAAALASAAVSAGCENPLVCLSPVADESKRPALDAAPASEVGSDATVTSSTPDAKPIPVACLSVAMPRDAGHKPLPPADARPCLKVYPDD